MVFILILCLGVAPIAFIYQIANHINMYQMFKFNERFGSLFEGVDLRTKWNASFYLIFCTRRVICVMLFFLLAHHSGLQLVYMMWLNLLILIYMGRNLPLVGKLSNRLEVFNEVSVCFITFQMTFFTHYSLGYDIKTVPEELLSPTVDLLPDEPAQERFGYLMNTCMFYYIYANLLVIFYFIIRQLSLLLTRYCRIWKFNCCGFGKI